MSQERNKFLTEAMGGGNVYINKHGEIYAWLPEKDDDKRDIRVRWPDFSTWPGFGKLWELAQAQEWWSDFLVSMGAEQPFGSVRNIVTDTIHPDRFADAVYEFLQERTG